jgi:Domain of unknown function (DUF4333)
MLRSRAVSSGPPHLTLVLLLVLSIAMGACMPRMLDGDQLERRLARQLSDQLDVQGIRVECPDDAEARQGLTLECIARAPGETEGLRVAVTQVDGDGNVTWEIQGAAG